MDKSDMNLHVQSAAKDVNLEYRIADFKKDPEKVKQINEILDDLFEKAKIEAEMRQAAQLKGKTMEVTKLLHQYIKHDHPQEHLQLEFLQLFATALTL